MTLDLARVRQIGSLAAPPVLSLIAQTLAGLLGTALISRFGLDALAGVGVAGAIYATMAMALLGLDTGVQALVARMGGENRWDDTGEILADAVIMSAVAGLVLAIVAEVFGPLLLSLILHRPAAVAQGGAYLRALAPSLVFMGAIYAFGAFWNATGRPKVALFMNLMMIAVGLVLGVVLMFGLAGAPALGVTGAGIGIAVANLTGTVGHVVAATRLWPVHSFTWRRPDREVVRQLLRIGAPISVQQSLVNFGTYVWFGIVGLIGAAQVALANVFLRFENLAIFAAVGVGIGTATLVGWSMGAKNVDNAKRWGWEGALFGAVVNVPLALFLMVAPSVGLGVFIRDPAVAAMGEWPLRLIGLTLLLDTFSRVLGFGMRGAGATGYIASVNLIVNWLIQLPLGWFVGVRLGYGLAGMAVARLAVVALECLLVAVLWHGERWTGRRPPKELPGEEAAWAGGAIVDVPEA